MTNEDRRASIVNSLLHCAKHMAHRKEYQAAGMILRAHNIMRVHAPTGNAAQLLRNALAGLSDANEAQWIEA